MDREDDKLVISEVLLATVEEVLVGGETS
jgi:hypothetical protein